MEPLRTSVTVIIALALASCGETQPVPPCQPGPGPAPCVACLNADGDLCTSGDVRCTLGVDPACAPAGGETGGGGSGGTGGGGDLRSCIPGSSPFIPVPCIECLNSEESALCVEGDSDCMFGLDPTRSNDPSCSLLPGGGDGITREDIPCDEEPNGKESCCTCDEQRNVWDCPMPTLSQGCSADDEWDCCNCICDSGRWDCDPDPDDVKCILFTASQQGGFGSCQVNDITPGGSSCLACLNEDDLECESGDNCVWGISPFCGRTERACAMDDVPPAECSDCSCLDRNCEVCAEEDSICAWNRNSDICCLNMGSRRRGDMECTPDDPPPVCCQGCSCLNTNCEDCENDDEECVWHGSVGACEAGSGGMSKNSTESMGGKTGMSMKNSSESRGGKSSLEDFDLSNLPLGGRCDPDKDTDTDTTIPCLNCGCFPSEESGGPQGRYKCQLYGDTPSCSDLQDVWQVLSEGCDRGDVSPIDEEQCQCECNLGHKEWKCKVTAANNVDLSPVCQLALKQKNIELPPARTRDISALFPQPCEKDGVTYLMGSMTVADNCDICVCVDGCWQCVQDESNCDSDGMVIQSAVSCSDREAPFYPLGTYSQQGVSYSICVFESFQDASFVATMSKPGTCPAVTPPADPTVCEGMVNECVFDIECMGGEKCCFGDCETTVCVTPDYPPECPEESETFGVASCEVDANCTSGQLCCSTGLGYECVDPVTYDPAAGVANPDMPIDDEERIYLEPCVVNGEEMLTGNKWTDPDDPCTECVCLNGNPECYTYSPEDCQLDPLPPLPTCSCGPPGVDSTQQEIQFGTIWHVNRCDVCVCLSGEWICRQVRQCRPDVQPPRPCQLSAMISVPTGHISDNGCCMCINGQWTCDRPGCTDTEGDAPANCEAEDGSEVRHGSYTVEGCTLCICVNGNIRCLNTCENRGRMMDRGEDMMADDRLCPAASVRCPSVASDRNQCNVDGDCPVANSVCCTNGCVNICIEPADAGVAVACPDVMCSADEIAISQCAADEECMEGTVCCRDRRGCFGRCVPTPAPPKPGVCPSVIAPPQIPTAEEAANEDFNVFGECAEDSECADDMKCCGGAIKECTEPEIQPAALPCMDNGGTSRDSGYIETGARDADLNICNVCVCIDGSWICEELECTDVAPTPTLLDCNIPGMRTPSPSGATVVLECNIRVCFDGQWLVRDLIACEEVRVEKPGECPRGELLPEQTCPDVAVIPACTGDQSCSGEMKCCFDGCSVSCIQPVDERAGECPVPTAGDLSGTCTADVMDSCILDTDCSDSGFKCCFDGCRKSCKQPAVVVDDPMCQDMEDPSAPPYSNGQVVRSGVCNICVCVGTDWLCTLIPDEACNTTVLNNCYDGRGLLPTIPSGTLQRRGCLQRACLNGTWETSFADDCCPDLSATCTVDGIILTSGETQLVIVGDVCNACICVNGIMVCKQLMATSCVNDAVDLPCWRGARSVQSGTIIPRENDICGCFFGQWKCFSRGGDDAPIDIKPGMCPESFDVLEPDEEDQRPGNSGNNPGRGQENGNRGMARGGRGQGNQDEWGPSGVAGRGSGSGSSEEDGGEVIERAKGRSKGGSSKEEESKGASKEQSKSGQSKAAKSRIGDGDGRGEGRRKRQSIGARRKRQDQPDESEDTENEVDMEQDEIQDAIEELQDTVFDGCLMDSECSDQQICCGLALGGTCTDPQPEESVPLSCYFNDRYYRHGSLRDESEDGECEACVCVHGEWTCDEYTCSDGLYDCVVGYEILGLTVPSGSQQFLQCELCVCLNGDWICNDRACSNGESEALCPVGIPPNINPRNPNVRCGDNSDCEDGDRCCEYDNFGRVCVPPQVPNEKNGECPASIDKPCPSLRACFTDANCPGMMKCCRPEDILDECEVEGGQGVCTKPAGNPCPGNRPYTPCVGDINPCDVVGECASDPDLTCEVSECSRCEALFYDKNGKEKKCQALEDVTCDVEGGRPPARAGTAVDRPNRVCNQCLCGSDGTLTMCGEETCGEQIDVSLSFDADNSSFILNDEFRRQEFINQIRQIIMASTGLDARDIRVRSGSIIANMTFLGEEGQTVDEEKIEKIRAQVDNGDITIVIDGVEYVPIPDSFVDTPVPPQDPVVTSTTVIVIAVLVTIVIVTIIIAGTVCYLKSRKSDSSHGRGDVPMKAGGGYDNSSYQ